jgi:hypothetical protein
MKVKPVCGRQSDFKQLQNQAGYYYSAARKRAENQTAADSMLTHGA